MKPDDNKKPLVRKSDLSGLALVNQLGITLAVSIALPLFVGHWLDGLLDTSPWLFLIFTLLGIGSAFRNMYVLVNRTTGTGSTNGFMRQKDLNKKEKSDDTSKD